MKSRTEPRTASLSSCLPFLFRGIPVHSEIDVQRRNLDVLIGTVFGVTRHFKHGQDCTRIALAKLQYFLHKLAHVLRGESLPLHDFTCKLPGALGGEVANFTSLRTVRIKRLQ